MTTEELEQHFQNNSTEAPPENVPQGTLAQDTPPIEAAPENSDPNNSVVVDPSVPENFFEEMDEKIFKQNILFPLNNEDGSDYVVPKTMAEFTTLLQANKTYWEESANNQKEEDVLGKIFEKTSPALQFLAQNANNFTSIQDMLPLIQSVQSQDQLSNLDSKNEQHQEFIVASVLRIQGLDDESIEEEIADLKQRNMLESRAEKQLPVIEKYQADQTAKILEEESVKNKEEEQFWGTYYQNLQDKLVKAVDVDGMHIKKEDKDKILSYLLPTKTGLPLYDKIDALVGAGEISKLVKAIMILEDDPKMFDTYYSSSKNTQIAKGLQTQLRTSLVANNSKEDAKETKQTPKVDTTGYGLFLNK